MGYETEKHREKVVLKFFLFQWIYRAFKLVFSLIIILIGDTGVGALLGVLPLDTAWKGNKTMLEMDVIWVNDRWPVSNQNIFIQNTG